MNGWHLRYGAVWLLGLAGVMLGGLAPAARAQGPFRQVDTAPRRARCLF